MSELGSGSGSSYPGSLDTDSTVEVDSPSASKTLARAAVPNDLAAAVVAIETELGTDPAGTKTDVKTFLQVDHNTDGTEKISKTYMLDTGSANTYAIAPTPAITVYTAGNRFSFKAVNANTGASTLNVNALGAKTILKGNDQALVSGDIEAGQIVDVQYDGTNFQMLSVCASSPWLNAEQTFTARQSFKRNGQVAHTSGALESSSATGDVYFSLHAVGDTAAALKHTRGGNGLEILDANNNPADLSFGTMTAGTVPHGRTLESVYATGTTVNTDVSFSSVAVGDLIFVTSRVSWTAGTTEDANIQIVRLSGATVATEPSAIHSQNVTASQPYIWNVSGVFRVTSAGALTLRSSLVAASPVSITNEVRATRHIA